MTHTSIRATNTFYEKSALARLLRWGLWITGKVSGRLTMHVAARLFITPLPHKWTQRPKAWDDSWKRESWPFEKASLSIYSGELPEVEYSEANMARRPSVLLVHGWGGHAAQMLPLATALREQGMHVVIVEMPAHGHSKGSKSTLPQFARALSFTAIKLASEGRQLRTLVAHSLAASASAYAVSRGLVTERLVLIAPPASPHAFTRLFATFFNIDEPTRHMMQDHIEVNEGVRMADFEPPSVGPGMNLPVLIAHDSADSVNSLIDGQAFHKVIAGAQLYQTNGLGHRRILKDKLTIEEITRFILRD